MPTCRNCGESFPNRLRINGVIHNVGSRRFCLVCSPFGSHNTKKNLATITTLMPEEKWCPRCKTPKSIGEFYRTSRKIHSWCKSCNNAHAQERQRRFKQQCIDYKGGCCQHCGYNRCAWALEFHHLDPSQKDFAISRKCHTLFDLAIMAELDKCVLLCSNCHTEIHAGIMTLNLG